MIELVTLSGAENQTTQDVYRDELIRLRQPAALKQRLAHIDSIRPFRRLYVMGCGRSGTWLLTATMSTFDGLEVVPKELTFEYFGLFLTKQSMLVLKRDHVAYRRVEDVPESVEIAYIVRHPFDVLTSLNPTTQRLYHITPDRWLGEMLALQHLVNTDRKNVKIVRYEDLVGMPHKTQSEIAAFFGLKVRQSIDEIDEAFKGSPEAISAMHGLRKIDVNSVNKYKTDPVKLEYLKTIRPRLGRVLQWIGESYQYDISI